MTQSRIGEDNNSFHNNSFNTNSFDNTILFNQVSQVNNFGTADERAEVLAWLSPLDSWIRHREIRDHRVEDVGEWLLQKEEYRNWLNGVRCGESDHSALFCHGDPGVGKTYITSLVIDRLCDWARGQNATVVCFYFDFAAQKEQSPTTVLSSLLQQVVRGLEEIPAKIVEAFRDQKKTTGGRSLGLSQVVEMLQDISSSRPTFICIDALDECIAEYRVKLLQSLRRILHKSPGMRIFLAGRSDVQDEVEKQLAGSVVAVYITPTKDDIRRFLRAKLEENTTLDAMDNSLEEDILKSIPERVSEIFLLVSLNIKAILQETTLYRRREKLDAVTYSLGLGDAYDATIGRIKAQKGDRARLGMAALMWISHSERLLSVDEICHALAVEIGSTDVDADNVPSIRTVLDCCQGLAVVDKRSSNIRLIHFTLKEYLSCHADLFDKPHSGIAETCLTYLNFKAIRDLSARPSPDLQGTPFLKYASLYWGTHMRLELSDRSRHLAHDLLDQYDNHVSAELLWNSTPERSIFFYKPFSALHCVSYFGLAEVGVGLLRTKRWDVNGQDGAGRTPLIWAASYGREEVVELLLQQKHTQPDMSDTYYGRTALSWAAGGGHEGVVRLFLGRAFPGSRDIGPRWRKTQQVINPLRRKHVNPERPDIYGQTPLAWAAGKGHAGVVDLLLGQEGVSADKPDNYGRTPLWLAARDGHDEVVKLLLGRGDVSPDRLGNDGRTPLWLAAQHRHVEAVKILLERNDLTPDMLSDGGPTLLLWATENGHDRVVQLLLGREEISRDMPGHRDPTLLLWAAENGHDGVVNLLLGRKDVSPDKPDKDGRTLLSWGACNGRDEVVKLLLEREDVNPDKPDNHGRTPLTLAAKNGHEGVVRLLLERKDVNPDKPNKLGITPLSLATNYRHTGIVKLLEARKAAIPAQ